MRRLILLALICASFAAPQTQSANNAPRLHITPTEGVKPVESYEVPDFDKEQLIPLKKAQEEKAAREAEAARLAEAKRLAEEAAARGRAYRAPVFIPAAGNGFIMSGNNCVACVHQMTGRRQNGDAGRWRPSHSSPRVGDIMIFWPGEQGASGAGHVGVVKGVNADGTVSIAHCAWYGGQTTFYSTGKFW